MVGLWRVVDGGLVDDVSLFRAEVLVLVLGVSLSVWPDRGMDGWMDGWMGGDPVASLVVVGKVGRVFLSLLFSLLVSFSSLLSSLLVLRLWVWCGLGWGRGYLTDQRPFAGKDDNKKGMLKGGKCGLLIAVSGKGWAGNGGSR